MPHYRRRPPLGTRLVFCRTSISCYAIGVDYEAVNGLLVMIGQEPIPEPAEGSGKEKLQHLLDVYTARLVAQMPEKFAALPPEFIPDAILQGLRSRIAEL
jgi:hypothetical protein